MYELTSSFSILEEQNLFAVIVKVKVKANHQTRSTTLAISFVPKPLRKTPYCVKPTCLFFVFRPRYKYKVSVIDGWLLQQVTINETITKNMLYIEMEVG